MDIVVYRSGTPWATPIEAATIDGFKVHGLDVEVRPKGDWRKSDVAVVWGHRDTVLHDIQKDNHYLVLERGHLHPRRTYTAMSWDGLGRRGRYPKAPNGDRWNNLFAGYMKSWKSGGSHVVIFGQVLGDASLVGVDFHAWVSDAVCSARVYGLPVIFRPHPRSAGLGDNWRPDGCEVSACSLESDLDRAAVAITYNSTSGVEAVLAGVPTVCCDPGAMAWPVAGHDIGKTITPYRTEWAHDLAYTNWTLDEIADGTAWAAERTVIKD